MIYYIALLHILLCAYHLTQAGDFPIKIVNKTNNAAIKNIYILVKGINPSTNNQCFIALDPNGSVGKLIDITPNTKSTDFAYDYKVFKNHTIHLPHLISGRIYISINSKLNMPIVGTSNRLGIADPSPYNTTDHSYNLFFDKVEFTYINNNTWTNPTAVDFFALPLSIEQDGKNYGLTAPREAIIASVQQIFKNAPNNAWKKLIVTNDRGTVLRILAPGRDNNYFDVSYLTGSPYNYVNDVWNYYKENTVIVDCSELRGNTNAPKLGDYYFEGKVINDMFVFTNKSKDYTVEISKPSSNSFFLAAQGAFEAANNTPKAIIVRNLSAAWCVGLLPTENGAVLNRNYYEKRQDEFYTHNKYLSPASKNTGPYYNLYGKAFHQWSKTIYTWAYDDAFGYDGTNGSTADHPATLTIWDMSTTNI